MTKFTTIALAGLLAASAPVAVNAAGINVDAGAGLSAGGSDSSAGAGLSGSADTRIMTDGMETGGMPAATVTLTADQDTDAAIDMVTTKDQVRLFLRSHVQDAGSHVAGIFENAAGSGMEMQDHLKTRVEANATLVAALDAQGFSPDEVVAVRSTTDGSVVLFVDDVS